MERADKRLRQALESVVEPRRILTDPAERWAYGYDNSRQEALPSAVVFPQTHEEVRGLVRICNDLSLSIVARGRGTGTTGATVPLDGAVVLAMERMNKILEVDPDNRTLRTEPGVTNQSIQTAAARHGFFWPPDPTSAATCTVGGNLAYNSAGPRAVKYGTPRENTLALRAVTGFGESIRTGVNTTKGVVGYDLTRLLIGSEGTLAVITEAVLKLTPLAEAKTTLRALYSDVGAAASAVSRIMSQPVAPCALEFMDAAALAMVKRFSDLGLPEDVGALLMIEVDGSAACLESDTSAVARAAEVPGLIELRRASSDAEVSELWKTRKALSPALRNVAPKKINEDVVVPVARIPALISGIDELSRRHGIPIVNFGHAGNGNIHVNILFDPTETGAERRALACLDALFALVLALQGTLSGEHGVGLVKRDYVSREIDPVTLSLMRSIKAQFDPNNILNPGKMLPPP